MYLFELQFYLSLCPVVGLLGHKVALVLVFYGTSILFNNYTPIKKKMLKIINKYSPQCFPISFTLAFKISLRPSLSPIQQF